MRFEIICTGHNCEAFVKKCYESVLSQTYTNWGVTFISDGSTDGTGAELGKLPALSNMKFHIYDENMGAAYRRMEVIRPLDDESVCLLLGMDDELLPNCLERVKKEYDLGKWMTYGNWIDQNGHTLPPNFDLHFDEKTHKNRDYRKVLYRSTAPNTFKKFLFNEIPDEDFKLNGKWIDSTTESHLMFSCLEMCGKERIGVITEPIYMYNRNRPTNTVNRKGREYQKGVYDEMTKRPKKPLLDRGEKIVTVGLPVLKMPAWLAMESLCAQETKVKWELIVYEDADEPNGEGYYKSYFDRLRGCQRIIYIYSKDRVSLSSKWREMKRYMDSKSLGLLLQAADCYSDPNRIERTYELLNKGCHWVHAKRGYFHNLKTGQTMLFNGLNAETGLNMALSKEVLERLSNEDKYSGVDNWLYTHAKGIEGFKEGVLESPTWDKGVDTDGWNRISDRTKLYNHPAPPFTKANVKIETILPDSILLKLRNPFIKRSSFRVLNISSNDWANYSYYNAQSLRAAGVECDGLKLHPHSFGYAEQHEVVLPHELQRRIRLGGYDIIQIFNSDWTMLHYLQGYKGKIVVYHTGTGYRNKSHQLNEKLNPVVWKSIIALGEFAPLGAKNASYISVAVDTDKMKPNFVLSKPYRFLHCPSHTDVKGTETIKRLIHSIGDIHFKADARRLPHEESWKRMLNCEVYVELFKPELDGRKYGSFGTTAAEAAALGKVVVTQNLSPEVYEDTYGKCPLILAKDEKDFVEKIKWLRDLPEREMLKLQHAHRDWAVSKHSYLATGERLRKTLEL